MMCLTHIPPPTCKFVALCPRGHKLSVRVHSGLLAFPTSNAILSLCSLHETLLQLLAFSSVVQGMCQLLQVFAWLAAEQRAMTLQQAATPIGSMGSFGAGLDAILLETGLSAATCSQLLERVEPVLASVLDAPTCETSVPQQYESTNSASISPAAQPTSSFILDGAATQPDEATALRFATVAVSLYMYAMSTGMQLFSKAYEAVWNLQALQGELTLFMNDS